MRSLCPQCDSPLGEFAFDCEDCGWQLISDEEPDVESALDQQPLEADLHMEQALVAMEEKRFGDAVVSLNRAIADATPDRIAEAYGLRGYAHLRNGEFERSEKDCSESIRVEWTDAQTHAWRAAARGEQNKWREAFSDLAEACRLAGEKRDPFLSLMQSYLKPASEYFREEIRKGRRCGKLFNERGWVYLRAENYPKAIRDFEQSLKLEPDYPWAAYGWAMALFLQRAKDSHRLEKIIDLCDRAAVGESACSLEVLHLRAKVNHEFGRVAKSAKNLARISERSRGKPAELVRCGELRLHLGDPIAAISDFTAAVELDPDSPLPLKRRACCFFDIGNYPLAIEDFGRFIRVYPNDVTARIRRGQSLLKMHQPREALADFDRALRSDSNCYEARLGRSEVYCLLKRPDEALSETQKAVAVNNTRSKGFASLGEVYMELCDFGRAIENFGSAIQRSETESDQAEYLYRRGVAHYELNQFDAANDDFSLSTMLRPHHSGAWIWNAAACSHLEKWEEAIIGLKQAIAVNPAIAKEYRKLGKPVAARAVEYFNHQQQRMEPNAALFRSRGLAHQFLGDHDRAIDDFTAALNIDAENDESLIRRGQSYAQTGEHAMAIDDFTTVIRIDRKNHRARYWRAYSRFVIGMADRALVDVVKAIRSAAKVAAYHVLHGELLSRTGKPERAIRAFDRAVRLDASDAKVYRRRAAVHMQQNEYLESIRDFTRSLEINPASHETLVLRGAAFLKLERFAEAKKDFEMALTFNERIAKAYSGRAAALLNENRHEYVTVWLTKAIHRFESPRDISEILFARGKMFYQMKRFEPAIADFSAIVDLMRSDPKTLAAARMARGIARVQLDDFDMAQSDFQSVLDISQRNPAATEALGWLANRDCPRPALFSAPQNVIRPTRPAVVGSEVELTAEPARWDIGAPYDTWVLRTTNHKEFGPVRKEVLDQWVADGRIVAGMKVLRADWGKWKKVERIYPLLENKQIEIFPAIDLGPDSSVDEKPNTE